MKIKNIVSFIGISVLSFQCLATPAQVIIIRHGEKPDDNKMNEVSQQGCERAYSLPQFFLHNSTVNAHGKPVAIYGMAPNGNDGTIRCIQVIAVTAKDLNLNVDTSYAKDEAKKIAKDILNKEKAYDGRTVLIAWEHTAIAELASELGLKNKDEPKPWPGSVFDEAWVLDYTKGGSPSLTIIPEYVLPTDNPKGGLDNWTNGPQNPPGNGPKLADSIKAICSDNNALNDIVEKVASPSLDKKVFDHQ